MTMNPKTANGLKVSLNGLKVYQKEPYAIAIHPDVQKRLNLATDVSFLGLIRYGWRLFYLSFEDWRDVMSGATFPDEFFYHLGYRD
jgi:hypothetical protein